MSACDGWCTLREGYVLDSTMFVIPTLPVNEQEEEPSRVKISEGRVEPSCERPRHGHQPVAAKTRLDDPLRVQDNY